MSLSLNGDHAEDEGKNNGGLISGVYLEILGCSVLTQASAISWKYSLLETLKHPVSSLSAFLAAQEPFLT